MRFALAALVCGAAGCARPEDGAPVARAARTVFTDSALFREQCLEADSGHTLDVRRCTPRDQGHRPTRPEPTPPAPPPER